MLSKPRTFALFAVLIMVAAGGRLAVADDFAPPIWRGDPLSTVQQWDNQSDFGGQNRVGDPALLPDGPLNDPADPVPGLAYPNLSFSDLSYWTFAVDWNGTGRVGWVYDSSAPFPAIWQIEIPNWPDDMPFKDLRIQFTVEGSLSLDNIIAYKDDWDPYDLWDSEGDPDKGVEWVAFGGDAQQFYWDYRIYPNPDFEILWGQVDPGTFIDQVIVDTRSYGVPEPTSASLLASVLGLIGLTGWKRRRTSIRR
jgi:hypothetical protein